MRGVQNFRVGLGADDHDALYASQFGGNDGHQQRGDECESSAGDVTADRVDGTHELGDLYAGFDFEGPRSRQLFSCDGPDVSRGVLDSSAKLFSDLHGSSAQLLRREPQAIALQIRAIEFLGPGVKCGVASLAHIRNDARGDALRFSVALRASLQEPLLDLGCEL